MGQIKKTYRYFLSKQGGTVWAKKPSHATITLKPLLPIKVIPVIIKQREMVFCSSHDGVPLEICQEPLL
jgi:hypothetical protein